MPINGELVYSHTAIILRRGDEFFHALTKNRYSSHADIDPNELNVKQIGTEHMWPLLPQDFTRAPNPLPANSYVKTPSLIDYNEETAARSPPSDLLLQEARICEILRKNPQSNIAEYLDCVVNGNRISGLCFVKYDASLATLVNQKVRGDFRLNKDRYLKGIEAGIRHLHELNLVHNDLNPSNLMNDHDNFPRIIDFDSCQKNRSAAG